MTSTEAASETRAAQATAFLYRPKGSCSGQRHDNHFFSGAFARCRFYVHPEYKGDRDEAAVAAAAAQKSPVQSHTTFWPLGSGRATANFLKLLNRFDTRKGTSTHAFDKAAGSLSVPVPPAVVLRTEESLVMRSGKWRPPPGFGFHSFFCSFLNVDDHSVAAAMKDMRWCLCWCVSSNEPAWPRHHHTIHLS